MYNLKLVWRKSIQSTADSFFCKFGLQIDRPPKLRNIKIPAVAQPKKVLFTEWKIQTI